MQDDPGDALIATEAPERATRNRAGHEVHLVGDGQDALNFLRREGRFLDVGPSRAVPRLEG